MAIKDFRPKLGLLSPRPLPRSLECIFSLLLSSCFCTSHLNLPPAFYVCCRSLCFWKAGWNCHAVPPEIYHTYCWPEVLPGPCCDRWCLVQAVSRQQRPGQCGRCGWWSQGGTGNLPSVMISHMSLLTTQGVPSHFLIFKENIYLYLFIWLCWVLVAACGIKFPDQGLNLGSLCWEHGVLATGSPGNSTFKKFNIQKTKIMVSGPITSWQIDGETMETVTNFIPLGCKINADGDCSHEIKRCLLPERKAMINLDGILKNRGITLLTKVCIVKATVFPVVTDECKSWTIKNAES